MGGFGSFVRKEALHILRDPRTMLIVLLMPVVQMLLFGFAISTEVNNIDFAAVVPRHSEEIRRQVERMSSNDYFTFQGYIPSEDIDAVLRRGDADLVVVFDPDYDRRIADTSRWQDVPAIQLVFDASNPNIAASGAGYAQRMLSGVGAVPPVQIETHTMYNPQMKSAYNFVPGIMGLVFLLICSMMTSVSIVREKETGTMEVLLVSPVRPLWIVLAKMIPYFVLSCVNLTTILLLAHFALDVPLTGSLVSVVGISLLYIALALALGLFISTFARTQVVAILISGMMLMMPVIMLSGMVFPIENMPGILQGLSCIIPARWYIEAMRKLMIEGVAFGAVLREFFILLAMTVALVAVALRKFNDKLE